MTREESIKRLDEQTFKDLAKESCGDCISRQAAINSLGECPMNWTDSDGEITAERDWKDTVEMLKRLPSVIPQPKTEVLDKIRAEILDEAEYAYADFDKYKEDILYAEPDELPDDDFRFGMERAVEIINKYKSESEDKE